MTLIVLLAFTLWLHVGIPQVLASFSSIALGAIAVFALAEYTTQRWVSEQVEGG